MKRTWKVIAIITLIFIVISMVGCQKEPAEELESIHVPHRPSGEQSKGLWTETEVVDFLKSDGNYVYYDSELEAFCIIPQGDYAEALQAFVSGADNADVYDSWLDEQVRLCAISRRIRDHYGSHVLNLANPDEPDLAMLQLWNGEVVFSWFDGYSELYGPQYIDPNGPYAPVISYSLDPKGPPSDFDPNNIEGQEIAFNTTDPYEYLRDKYSKMTTSMIIPQYNIDLSYDSIWDYKVEKMPVGEAVYELDEMLGDAWVVGYWEAYDAIALYPSDEGLTSAIWDTMFFYNSRRDLQEAWADLKLFLCNVSDSMTNWYGSHSLWVINPSNPNYAGGIFLAVTDGVVTYDAAIAGYYHQY